MDLPSFIRVVIITVIFLVHSTGTTELGTYCQNEELTATCGKDEIVLMRSAWYGRMQLSRCVRKDYGYIGCGEDVTNVAHALCSGRHDCVIPVPNEELDAKPPCPEDFKSYLEAGYDCIKVVQADRRQCDTATHVEITAPSGTIASIVTKETGCGSHTAPWLIKALPGQVINVYLVDFSGQSMERLRTENDQRCIAYAILREKNGERRTTICGKSKLEDLVYVSIGHEMEVLILGTQNAQTTRHFLLKYSVSGCPDLPQPRGGWARRTSDVTTLGCHSSSDTWRVVCKDDKWQGEIGNCTSDAGAGGTWSGTVPVSFGVSIGIIILIALGIAGCILLAGLICMHRRRREAPRKHPGPPPPPLGDDPASEDYKKSLYGYSRQKTNAGHGPDIYWSRRETGGPMSENEYASIQDGFPPVSPTGTAMPDLDFSHQPHSSLPPPPYRDGQHPGHFITGTGNRYKGERDVTNARGHHGLSQSTGSLDTEAREYFVLDPEDSTNGHKMLCMSDR